MKQAYFIKITNLILLLFAIISSFAQKEVDFRINLEEGICFKVQSTHLSQGSIPMDKEVKESKSESTMVIQYNTML